MATGFELKDALEVAEAEQKRLQEQLLKVEGFITYAREMLEGENKIKGNGTAKLTASDQVSPSPAADLNLSSYSLKDMIEKVLEDSGQTMSRPDIMKAIQETGYRTGDEIPNSTVTSALKRSDRIRKIKRGMYRIKKSD